MRLVPRRVHLGHRYNLQVQVGSRNLSETVFLNEICTVPETAAEIATTTTQAINTTGVTDVEDSVKKPLSCYVGGKTKNVKQRLVDEQGYKTVQCLESEYCVDYSMTSPADETLNINIKNCDGEIGELDAMIPRGNVDCKDLIENGNGCHMLRDDGIFKLKVCCCESDMCNNVGIELSNISAARNTTSSLKLSGPDVEIMGNESSEKLAPISSGNKPSV
ncbi:unnamed protein product [Anisakis simplex]|uniref:Activin_recp domain-containing protein n=1 Tax=Anisakis simplex TaxID=6269 RepID=A0A0M3K2H5_ANISI|nr:unnamed protein product [Anisakis simplex]